MAVKNKINFYKKILFNPNIDVEQLDVVEKGLKDLLKEAEDYRIYVLLGKLYHFKGNYQLAKNNFLNAKRLNKKASSIYNGLFKINLMEQDYESAKENIEEYDKLQWNVNLELYKLLIDKILKVQGEYNIDDVFVSEKLNGDNLILYLTAIKYILDNNYDKAIEKLEQLNTLIKVDNLPITFDYIIDLVKTLKLESIFDEKIEKLKDYIWNQDAENIKILIDDLIHSNLTDKQVERMLHIIPKLINIDEYVIALYVNNSIKKIDRNLKFSRMTSFYERYINELKKIYNLHDDEKETFQSLLRNGLDCYNNGEFIEALDYFMLGCENTDIPLFNYYVGKTLFVLGKYKESRRSLNLYNEVGAYKIYLCKHYLSIIDFMFGKKGKAIQLGNDAEYFSSLLNQCYESKINQIKTKGENNLEKLFKQIDIKEDDFIKRLNKD